jgi:hypothetical protein
MEYPLSRHKFGLFIPLLVLLFAIACAAATATTEPAGDAPQAEPTTARQ